MVPMFNTTVYNWNFLWEYNLNDITKKKWGDGYVNKFDGTNPLMSVYLYQIIK